MFDWKLIRLYARREDGQTMAEYGVVLGVIVIGVVTAIGVLAAGVAGKLGAISTFLGT